MNMYRFDLVSCAFNDKIPNKALRILPSTIVGQAMIVFLDEGVSLGFLIIDPQLFPPLILNPFLFCCC